MRAVLAACCLFAVYLLFVGGDAKPACAAGPGPDPPPVLTKATCVENTKECPLKAQKGECDTNRDYMLTHCQKSCKLCAIAVSETCFDHDPQCVTWENDGLCSTDNCTRTTCPQSCKLCTPGTP
uniref:MultiShKL5 n=1 Tax=Colubraria reticulata TaxID=604273 RepID=A0A481SPH0_9CAEN|nr:multiShKL5 [Colubraria reticulata]